MNPAETKYTESETITATQPNTAHPLPMPQQVIERELTQAHGDLIAGLCMCHTERECDAAMSAALRSAFTMGQDNGKALVLSAIDAMIAPAVGNAAAEQLGRSVEALATWLTMGSEFESRSYSVRRTSFADAEKQWAATAFRIDVSDTVYGASHAEALSKLATWCTEHIAAKVAK